MNKKAGTGTIFFVMTILIGAWTIFLVWAAGSVVLWKLWHWPPIVFRIVWVGIMALAIILGIITHFTMED